MRCEKCTGLVVEQYDVGLRESEPLCVNCGYRSNRQTLQVKRQVLLCRQCHVNPKSLRESWRGGGTDVELCIECRIRNARMRRARKEVKGGGKVAAMLAQYEQKVKVS